MLGVENRLTSGAAIQRRRGQQTWPRPPGHRGCVAVRFGRRPADPVVRRHSSGRPRPGLLSAPPL